VTPALIYPPNPRNLTKSLSNMAKVVTNCEPKMVLTDSKINALRWNPLGPKIWPDLPYVATDGAVGKALASAVRFLGGSSKNAFDEPTLCSEDLAFLQYTSGSTGDPKGVMVTFGNLMHNVCVNNYYLYDGAGLRAWAEERGSRPTGFSWLPQYHDLGLIYAFITPFFAGGRMHYMSPLTFITKPVLWMELITRHSVHWSMAPDFAYSLVVRKYRELSAAGKGPAPGSIDLALVNSFQSSAEPIRVDTVNNFNETFGPLGLRPNWFISAFGLAESVVGVCYQPTYDRSKVDSNLIAVGSKQSLHPSIDIRIVDRDSMREVPPGVQGELWVSSGSVAAGYLRWLDQDIEETFRASIVGGGADVEGRTYLRTGDMAFVEDDRYYICGRIKDMIIANGQNIYAQDLEHAAQEAAPGAVRPGCIAAFAKDETASDGIVEIVFEIRKSKEAGAMDVCVAVCAAVYAETGLYPARAVAIIEKTIPKTTSGKIRRRHTRAALHDGTLQIVADYEPSEEAVLRAPPPPAGLEEAGDDDSPPPLPAGPPQGGRAPASDADILKMALSGDARKELILGALTRIAGEVAKRPVEPLQPLMEAGLDSLAIAEFAERVQVCPNLLAAAAAAGR
jgi:acyl-CoA synthetase (AMP-forming)/AMP-acid ligase II